MIRAKFHCTRITSDDGYDNEVVCLDAVSDEKETNKTWAKFTPDGSLKLMISNPKAKGKFKILKEYFIDITPVEE